MSANAKDRATNRLSHQDLVLQLLTKAGAQGCTGDELARVHWRFGASLFELRRKGWAIATLEQRGTDVARYVLNPSPNAKAIPLQATLGSPPRSKPSAPVSFYGICECGHTAGQHKAHAPHACFDCDCTTFTPQA